MRSPKANEAAVTLGEMAQRKIDAGMNEDEAYRELLSGITQELKGESTAQQVDDFLAQFDSITKAEIEKQVTRLRGITSATRFRKHTLALLATIFDYGHTRGRKAGHRSEAARVLTSSEPKAPQ
jgi:hypothetical protein